MSLENTIQIEEAFFRANQNIVYCSYDQEFTFQTVKSQYYKRTSGVIPKHLKGKSLHLLIKIYGFGKVDTLKLVDYFSSSFSIINCSVEYQSSIVKAFVLKIVSALFYKVNGSAFQEKIFINRKGKLLL
tara:strand:- start:1840 stop:2226 length:387 start_codon:yes stop_codon:yes gene_type:complete